MSELKVYRPIKLVMQGRHNEPIYLKSEADKEIDFWKNESHKHYENWFNLNKQFEGWFGKVMRCERAERELRHQKYKRCLDRAKLCQWEMGVFIYKKEKSDFYYRWYNRWLELAKKFKEVNNG